MSEQLHRRCDCNACGVELSGPVSHGGTDGAYCSELCANHAGEELRIAQADHEREN